MADTYETLPPQPTRIEAQPLQRSAPAPSEPIEGFPTMEEIQALLEVANDRDFLKQHPAGADIQRLAKSINMLLLDERIPPEELQRLLNEMIPKLIELMESGQLT
jgi:hypothetical protein